MIPRYCRNDENLFWAFTQEYILSTLGRPNRSNNGEIEGNVAEFAQLRIETVFPHDAKRT